MYGMTAYVWHGSMCMAWQHVYGKSSDFCMGHDCICQVHRWENKYAQSAMSLAGVALYKGYHALLAWFGSQLLDYKATHTLPQHKVS